jgi:hypothetical protein
MAYGSPERISAAPAKKVALSVQMGVPGWRAASVEMGSSPVMLVFFETPTGVQRARADVDKEILLDTLDVEFSNVGRQELFSALRRESRERFLSQLGKE